MQDVTCKHSIRKKLMLILQYLKSLPKTSDEKLPDPNGALSETVPLLAIMKANEEVSKIH